MFNVDWKEGSNAVLGSLGADGAFVDENYADDHDLRVGSPIDLTFANGETEQFTIDGVFEPPARRLAVRQRHDLAGDLGRAQPRSRATSTRSCAPRAARPTRTHAALEQTLTEFPNAKVATRDEFIDNQISG